MKAKYKIQMGIKNIQTNNIWHLININKNFTNTFLYVYIIMNINFVFKVRSKTKTKKDGVFKSKENVVSINRLKTEWCGFLITNAWEKACHRLQNTPAADVSNCLISICGTVQCWT